MRATTTTMIFAGLLAAFGTPLPQAMAADAEILDIEPNLRARIARERAFQGRQERRVFGGGDDRGADADCGAVNIGNANSNDNSARGRLSQRQQTVIVTGPVINTARCR